MRTPTRLATLLLPLLALALAACSSTTVAVQQRAKDLSAYQTFAWAPPPAPEGTRIESQVMKDLRTSVERELGERGFRLVSKPDADLLVRADLTVELRVASRHGYNTGFYMADRYEDAVLVFRMVDPATQQPVWQSRGKRKLRREALGHGMYEMIWTQTGDDRRWKIDEMVRKVTARVPDAG